MREENPYLQHYFMLPTFETMSSTLGTRRFFSPGNHRKSSVATIVNMTTVWFNW